jgi:ATP-dependent protease ClpP protease subunit
VTGHITIYGEVGKQVTLDTVQKEITPEASEYVVHIHSNGGDVFDGYAIYNAIKNTGKKITVHIEGVCASIATLIAATGEKIIMNTKSQFMIHNPRISSMGGEAKDLRNAAGQLDRIKSQLIQSWVSRTNLSHEQLSDMYDHETWLTPEQAKEMGFVDEVQEVLKAVASADITKYINTMESNAILDGVNKIIGMISKSFSPKNLTETLADGRVITLPDSDDWVGQSVTLEDGTALEDGVHDLTSGKTITVAAGLITEVMEPEEEKPEEEKPEDMENLKEKYAAAEARIKELESALNTTTTAKTEAEAKARKFENKINTELKQVQDELKKITNTTAGNPIPPKKADKQQPDGTPVLDPMQAWFKKKFIDARNTD